MGTALENIRNIYRAFRKIGPSFAYPYKIELKGLRELTNSRELGLRYMNRLFMYRVSTAILMVASLKTYASAGEKALHVEYWHCKDLKN